MHQEIFASKNGVIQRIISLTPLRSAYEQTSKSIFRRLESRLVLPTWTTFITSVIITFVILRSFRALCVTFTWKWFAPLRSACQQTPFPKNPYPFHCLVQLNQKIIFPIGDRTRDRSHAKRTFYLLRHEHQRCGSKFIAFINLINTSQISHFVCRKLNCQRMIICNPSVSPLKVWFISLSKPVEPEASPPQHATRQRCQKHPLSNQTQYRTRIPCSSISRRNRNISLSR